MQAGQRSLRLWSWLFAAPAIGIVAFYLVYPALHTTYLSFLDRRLENFVGLDNYIRLFTTEATRTAIRNNLLWLVAFTVFTVGIGLLMAVLTDRVRYENVARSIMFMPMAISFAGAGVIWKFMYAYMPAGDAQIGLLNAIVVALGGEPIGWLTERPWINNFALIAVGVWIWTGFCMVILSAAYKGIPKELMEAARVDGANEWQVFWRVSLPSILPTVIVVATTMIINVLKIFDIIYVMTNGSFGTEVLANRMYKEMFQFRSPHMASAIAVVLFVVVLPAMLMNVRRLREESGRGGGAPRRTLWERLRDRLRVKPAVAEAAGASMAHVPTPKPGLFESVPVLGKIARLTSRGVLHLVVIAVCLCVDFAHRRSSHQFGAAGSPRGPQRLVDDFHRPLQSGKLHAGQLRTRAVDARHVAVVFGQLPYRSAGHAAADDHRGVRGLRLCLAADEGARLLVRPRRSAARRSAADDAYSDFAGIQQHRFGRNAAGHLAGPRRLRLAVCYILAAKLLRFAAKGAV